ncbi:YbaN family protein [Enterococcus sp. BWB1-3]|uniref:YbaN family protein n=1 Tax=Enterococcus sp. BWB1-3 TaxID=2787713 RepID=UPI001921DCE8|nr:YbaN family protein [Enterococcus sp. BWB1-3]MBL1230511.1 YbaN family protein [Enterococcus sp. BWB1-3]
MKKTLFIGLGAMTLGLGTLGIVVPFLPTAVFYLLTAFFWMRSSEKLYGRFIQSERYKQYVQEPIVKKNISTKNMLRMFIAIFIVFLIPCIFVDSIVMRITMACVYIVHVVGLTWYLKGKKNRKTDMKTNLIKIDERNKK